MFTDRFSRKTFSGLFREKDFVISLILFLTFNTFWFISYQLKDYIYKNLYFLKSYNKTVSVLKLKTETTGQITIDEKKRFLRESDSFISFLERNNHFVYLYEKKRRNIILEIASILKTSVPTENATYFIPLTNGNTFRPSAATKKYLQFTKQIFPYSQLYLDRQIEVLNVIDVFLMIVLLFQTSVTVILSLKYFHNKNLKTKAERLSGVYNKRLENIQNDFLTGLHDTVLQNIGYAVISLKKIRTNNNSVGPETEKIQQLLNETIAFIRDLLEKRPTYAIRKTGFIRETREIITKICRQSAMTAEVHLDPAIEHHPAVTDMIRLYTFQIIREAVQNSSKHAEAEEIEIIAFINDNALKIIIEDNGKGFSADILKGGNPQKGLGLFIIQERCTALNARIKLENSSKKSLNKGAVLSVEIPLKNSTSI